MIDPALMARLSPHVPLEKLQRAHAAFTDPTWRVVVAGRRSVGKSSLINALCGQSIHPTGLGGVTETLSTTPLHDEPNVLLVDTPAIETPGAVAHIRAEAARADRLIWVVDGLQPLARSARTGLRDLLGTWTSLHLVITRLDLLEPRECADVVQRVRSLAEPLAPLEISVCSPRSALAEGRRPLELLSGRAAPHRAAMLLDAIRAARPILREADRIDDSLRERWRALVRDVDLARYEASDPRWASHLIADFLSDARRHASLLFEDRGPLHLPLPVRASARGLTPQLGGRSHTDRMNRRSAAAWSLAGDMEICLWTERAQRPTARLLSSLKNAESALGATLRGNAPRRTFT